MRGATMTKKTLVMAASTTAALLSVGIEATTVNFVNQCSYTINLYDNSKTEDIATGGSISRELANGFSGMFRHGVSDQANLVEFALSGSRLWYDLSVIPPGSGSCKSYSECKQVTNNKSGYNVPVAMEPQTSSYTDVCKKITCESEQCEDAYLYPTDDGKTRNCPDSVTMKVIFCPSNSATTSAPTSTPTPTPTTTTAPTTTPSSGSSKFSPTADYESGVVTSLTSSPTTTPSPTTKKSPTKQTNDNSSKRGSSSSSSSTTTSPATTTSAPTTSKPSSGSSTNSSSSFAGATIKSSFSYTGTKAGSGQGTYNMVTKTSGCVKETVTVNSPVGPLSEEVSVVFRGPMEIYNIAVFDGSAGGDWKKVSSYSQSETSNMVFLNNKNVDYTTGVKSPQGLSSKDGLSTVSTAEQFSGTLADASDSSVSGGGAGVSTGAEVNIMTSTKCSADGTCKGYYDENGYHGWDGGKKMFVTKVKMPKGTSPNQPAIWMLNAQVLRSNQYGCNCRGSGAAGGCGELDIAEVIETNSARDKVTTHYYFYDGSVSAGGDNFASRPTDSATTYITIIDSDSSTIKILEIGESDFDFSTSAVASSQISSWVSASDKNLLS